MISEKGKFNLEASSVAKNTFNPIRNLADRGTVQPNPQKDSILLSLGDPTVFGNLKTHETVKDAVIKAVNQQQADGYAPAVGTVVARSAIIQRYCTRFGVNYGLDDIVITSGCSGALDMTISVLCSPGDAVLVPIPGFTLYNTLAGSKSVKTVDYRLDALKNWEIDLADVESHLCNNSNIRAWIINNPSNPCGSVYSEDHLKECLKLAHRYGVVVIADEIYEDMVFTGHEYIPLAKISQDSTSQDLKVPILTCSGLSKRFLVPGWRVGWVAIHQPSSNHDLSPIRRGLFDLSTLIIGSCTLVQAAMPEILSNTPEEFYSQTNQYLEDNAMHVSCSLEKIKGLHVVRPQGTLYLLVGIDMSRFDGFENDLELCELLMAEQSVSVFPGSIFGIPNYMRIVYAAPKEKLAEACSRMKEFFMIHDKQSQ